MTQARRPVRLEAFAGTWEIARDLDDRRDGRSGRFAGSAVFVPAAGGGLAYRETGTLSLGGAPGFTATRAYLWRQAGAAIEVRFEDGRLFHSFPSDEPCPEAAHDCPPDRYEVRYDFRFWPDWRAAWRVGGPRKDYVMVSRFTPAATR